MGISYGKSYCYGFIDGATQAGHIVFHPGGWQGSSAGLYRSPEQRLAIIVLSNTSSAPTMAEMLMYDLHSGEP